MNLPMMPGQKSIGANATRVVSVDVVTGIATSFVASREASQRPWPSVRKR